MFDSKMENIILISADLEIDVYNNKKKRNLFILPLTKKFYDKYYMFISDVTTVEIDNSDIDCIHSYTEITSLDLASYLYDMRFSDNLSKNNMILTLKNLGTYDDEEDINKFKNFFLEIEQEVETVLRLL